MTFRRPLGGLQALFERYLAAQRRTAPLLGEPILETFLDCRSDFSRPRQERQTIGLWLDAGNVPISFTFGSARLGISFIDDLCLLIVAGSDKDLYRAGLRNCENDVP
jgi:hypothetical protein